PRSVPTQPTDAENVAPTTAPDPELGSDAGDGGGVSGILIAVIVAMTAVVAGGIVLAGLSLVRRTG
ncbi:MAG: hypothetical protein J4O04_03175, partial [Chloroflexi bacterium]|nr:hypothetical protein [Chloroflexota bacterium]